MLVLPDPTETACTNCYRWHSSENICVTSSDGHVTTYMYLTDVQDATRWHRVMGPLGSALRRIELQFCVDGIPAFVSGGVSIKTAEYMILSLPPKLISKARNMLRCMLFPDSLKGPQQHKYYDWSTTYEMNDLHTRGVRGVRVIVYGTSLDSPGRAELLKIQSSVIHDVL